jgi:hypothetical protein
MCRGAATTTDFKVKLKIKPLSVEEGLESSGLEKMRMS